MNDAEITQFLETQKQRYIQWGELRGEKNTQWASKQIREMRNYYKKKGYFAKSTIISINGTQVNNLEKKLASFPDLYKTDITPKLWGVNNTIPAVIYKN